MATRPSEKDLAQHFQAHKDDAEEWEETPETAEHLPRSDSVVLSVRLKADEVDRLRELAHSQGVRISDLVREALLVHAAISPVFRIQYHAPRRATLAFVNALLGWEVTQGFSGATHWETYSGQHSRLFAGSLLEDRAPAMPCAEWFDLT